MGTSMFVHLISGQCRQTEKKIYLKTVILNDCMQEIQKEDFFILLNTINVLAPDFCDELNTHPAYTSTCSCSSKLDSALYNMIDTVLLLQKQSNRCKVEELHN